MERRTHLPGSLPPSTGPDVISGELPRFVELLRMSHGPVADGFKHCGRRPELEEIEELAGDAHFEADNPLRAIYKCPSCSRHFWGWWA